VFRHVSATLELIWKISTLYISSWKNSYYHWIAWLR